VVAFLLSTNIANSTVMHISSFHSFYGDGFCAVLFNTVNEWHIKVNWCLICITHLAQKIYLSGIYIP